LPSSYEGTVAASFALTTLELSSSFHKACAVEWPLFAELPEIEMREVLQIARRRRFARGEVVFHRDDPGDSLHLITKGRFAIRIMTPLGDRTTIAIRGPGDSFGEMALISVDSRRAATVSALEEAETHAVYRDDFAGLRRKHPSVDGVLIAFLAHEIQRQNELLLDALYVSAERRVLRRLVELAALYPTANEAPQSIPLTQEVLAELAGTSRATVNRVLNEEQRRGTLHLRRGRTLVRDLEALKRRARSP
jgi:CRP/FNR family cyclic AMP-dependent transcriptional regulator